MKDADYAKMTLEDLHALSQRAQSEIENRHSANRDKVIQQIKALAEENNIAVEFPATNGAAPRRRGKGKKAAAETTGRSPVPVKYQHPSNKDLKWTGRGRKPAWVNEWEEAKGSLDGLKLA